MDRGDESLSPRSDGSVDRGAEVETDSSSDVDRGAEHSDSSSDVDYGAEESDSSSEPDYGAGQPEYFEVESDEDREWYRDVAQYGPLQHPDTDYRGLFD